MQHRSRFVAGAILSLCALFIVMATSGFAAGPQLINNQGILLDGGGTPITVATSVEFRIWDDPAAGALLWSEIQIVTPDASGRYNVLLGSVTPIPNSAFDGDAYLTMVIAPDPEMTPRQRLVSVPFTYKTRTVDGASGGTITTKVAIGPGTTNPGLNAFAAGENGLASGDRSTVGGGWGNEATGASATVAGGGFGHASGTQSFIGGGTGNAASGLRSVIAGGVVNSATANQSFIGGGGNNTNNGSTSVIVGGNYNYTHGYAAFLGGGGTENIQADSNSAGGDYSVVVGGRQNAAFGSHAVIPGGLSNRALGDYSFAAGRRAKANHQGAHVWADATDADFSSTGNNQFLIRANGGVGIGTNSPGAALHVTTDAKSYTGYFTNGYGTEGKGVLGYYTGTGATDGIGVQGYSHPQDSWGIGGYFTGGYIGVYGIHEGPGTGYAGYFAGDVNVSGTLSKGAGSFKIDHPLDPENKYLYHSFVESPDMKNVYDGNVVLDADGSAVVTLPDYFEALNRDFRYQLTALGAPGPNLYVKNEISNGQFTIAGGTPGSRVSWQVTGIRQDAFANAHRIPVEENKPSAERGLYLYPAEFNQPLSKRIDVMKRK